MIDNFINILLIFPLVAGVLMLFIRKKAFDNFMLFLYAILHFLLFSILLFVEATVELDIQILLSYPLKYWD